MLTESEMGSKNRIWLVLAVIITTILLSGCNKSRCGDGICQSLEERRESCPEDCGEIEEPAEEPSPEPPSQEPLVKSIAVLVDEIGGRVDWSHENDLIAFSKTAEDGYFDVYIMNPDGTNQICLTCDKPQVPQKNNGQPAWHPSGEYIVFQVQDPDLEVPPSMQYQEAYLTQGGAGIHNTLWLMNKEGTEFYQLTHLESGEGTLHPHFSHAGSKLFWTERENCVVGGQWVLKIADFVIDDAGPRLENEISYRPRGENNTFYESHDFTPDDKKVIFSADIGREDKFDMDIWIMDLETLELTQLTDSIYVWDEHAQISPDGKKIVWISSQGYEWPASDKWAQTLKTDYWIMDIDGSNKQRLTFFNEPGYPEYNPQERIIAADSSWSEDGTKIVATLGVMKGLRPKGRRIVMIELNEGVFGEGANEVEEDSGNTLYDHGSGFETSITTISEKGGRVAWSPIDDAISFDRKGDDGYYDIWIMNADGSEEHCLTCDVDGLPQKHNGNPAWHPTGRYIAFQSRDPDLEVLPLRFKLAEDMVTSPGGAINNNLWFMTADGSEFWQLTNVEDGMGVLHPHFSHDGSRITWAEKIDFSETSPGMPGTMGEWSVNDKTLKIPLGMSFRDIPHCGNFAPSGAGFV
jgi:Tol biopolymer transport system component